MKKSTLKIVRCGIITALYVALTYACAPFSYGIIQIRISEMLTVLPLLYPESILSLALGCVLSNIGSPSGYIDIVIGSLTTFIAAICTYFVGKKVKNKHVRFFIGGIFPILLNALFLPLMWYFFCGEEGYFLNALSVGISQTICVYVLGYPLYLAFWKLKQKGIKGFVD